MVAWAVGAHPLGVHPLGNALLGDTINARPSGLGNMRILSDALLLHFMAEYLDGPSVVALGASSRMLYALASVPHVWRDLYARDFGEEVETWAGSWRGTYVAAALAQRSSHATDNTYSQRVHAASQMRVRARGVFSDDIYHAFLTAEFNPRAFLERAAHIETRRWQRVHKVATDTPPDRSDLLDNFTRVDARSTNANEFVEHYAKTSTPCILVRATDDWPCIVWTLDYVGQTWATRKFQAEAIHISGAAYVDYARSPCGGGILQAGNGAHLAVVPDTSPFYLFDARVASDTPEAKAGWRVPHQVAHYPHGAQDDNDARTRADLFSLFGDARPDFRWLIAGPARSGSGWHKDPNMTSAWNAVMQGEKYWMMLPPTTTPPGVYVSADQSEVTAPASISEWMLDFYAETKRLHGRREFGGDGQLIEGVCRAGEVMYVPSGWWHLVVNLDESVALTQNFVSVVELPAVLDFMKHTPDQISGFLKGSAKASLFDTFCAKLRAYDSALADAALARLAEREERRAAPKGDWRERLCVDSPSSWTLAGVANTEDLGEIPW